MIFTVFALAERKMFFFLTAGMCWYVMGIVSIELTTGLLQIPVFILFMMFGTLFSIGSVLMSLEMLANKRAYEEEEQWGVDA
jgi:hypothetical protein